MTVHSDSQKKAAISMLNALHDFERLARQENLGTLGYLLHMARLEARHVAGIDEA